MKSALTHEFKRVAVDQIRVPEKRQREKVSNKVGEIAQSIQRLGLINPITVTRDNTLVTGATRLEAYRMLSRHDPENVRWKTIQVQYVDELEPHQLRLVELEENMARQDLSWKEEALAILDYYEAKGQDVEEYTIADLSRDTSLGERMAGIYLQVGRALRAGDENVAASSSVTAAYGIVTRKMSNAAEEETQRFLQAESPESSADAIEDLIGSAIPAAANAPQPTISAKPTTRPDESSDVITGDFREWASLYEGPKFHFVHCDFPYGVGMDTSDQGAAKKRNVYKDDPSTYWSLVDAFCENAPHILASKAHIMFWFSMATYQETRSRFIRAGFVVNDFPLIWYKSDRIGIVPDVKRRPRQVYETAFLLTWGDRLLISPLPNAVSAPADKRNAQHTSEKPENMLRGFFKMFVDENTRVLDPTCGSGSALSAAVRQGAEAIFGLDLDPQNVKTAQRLITRAKLQLAAGVELVDTDEGVADDKDLSFVLGPSEEELEEIEREDIDIDDLSVDDLDL